MYQPNSCERNRPLSDLAEIYLERAENCACAGEWDLSVVWLERAVSYVPDNPHAWLNCARALEMSHRHAEAVGAAGTALRGLNSKEEQQCALGVIIRCCMVLEDFEGAMKAAVRGVEISPEAEERWIAFASVSRIAARNVGVIESCISALEALRDQ